MEQSFKPLKFRQLRMVGTLMKEDADLGHALCLAYSLEHDEEAPKHPEPLKGNLLVSIKQLAQYAEDFQEYKFNQMGRQIKAYRELQSQAFLSAFSYVEDAKKK